MITKHIFRFVGSALLMAMVAGPVMAQAQRPLLQSYVDTRVGTAASVTRTAGVFGQGTEEYAHTLPAVLSPYGMNFWTPQTQWTEQKGVCPYLYKDNRIQGFRCSHWIVGGCTQDYGSFTVTPQNSSRWKSRGSRFSHLTETASPSYYSVTLDDAGVKVEMTATQRAGIIRLNYDNPDSAYLFITVNSDEGEGSIETLSQEVTAVNPAHRIYQGWGERTGHAGHFVLRANTQIEKTGRVDKNTVWVKFTAHRGPVVIKMANSFVSLDGARNNLNREIPDFDFDLVRLQLERVWEKKLGEIEIHDARATNDDLCKFYGSMYRTSFLPHDISDADGKAPVFASYSKAKGTNDKVQGVNQVNGTRDSLNGKWYMVNGTCDSLNGKWYMVNGTCDSLNGKWYMVNGTCYDDFSMWDTYRAQHPLLTILEPKRDGEMMQSLVTKYMQGGWMPIFPCWNSYTAAMIGDHCASVIADAYVKGIRNFDVEKAYEGLRKNAFESPATYEEYCNGMGRRALESYVKYGYIPLEDSVKEAFHKNEQVSRTLEYAYDDYALAQLALGLGKKADYKQLMQRSKNYTNVFDPATGWVNGRHADGKFVTPDDTEYIKEPEKHPDAKSLTPSTFATFITEGVPVHYSWYVPHDVEGLVRCMGGKAAFDAKLDSMFSKGWYWHGNEPCHQIAYMYSMMGNVGKTAEAVSKIMDTEYLNAPGGLSGNDDAGQMSAWYVFSALGFYPVCPGTVRYYLGLPSFLRADVMVGKDKKFTIMNYCTSRDGSDLDEIRLNGNVLKRTYITHEEIMRGGVLEFIEK